MQYLEHYYVCSGIELIMMIVGLLQFIIATSVIKERGARHKLLRLAAA